MQRVEFRSGSFFVRGTITANGEVEDFEFGDAIADLRFEDVPFDTLYRLVEHVRMEQHRLMYPQVGPQQAGGPVVGGNKEPEPPIDGEING